MEFRAKANICKPQSFKKFQLIQKGLDHLFVKQLILLLIFISGAYGIFVARGLYADGSFFLYKILTQKDYWFFDTPRAFVQFITQFPLVFAIQSGIKDLNILIFLHSFGLIAPVITLWLIALMIQLRTYFFWILLVGFSLTYLTSGLFIIGEFNTTYALVALCSAILFKNNVGLYSSLALVLGSFILIRSYEAMVFLGPLLVCIVLYRLLKEKQSSTLQKVTFSLACAFFLVATLISIKSILFPINLANFKGALKLPINTFYFVYLALILSLYTLLHIQFQHHYKKYLAFIATLISLIYLFIPSLWVTPRLNYGFRSCSGLLLFSVILLMFINYVVHDYGVFKKYWSSFSIYSLIVAFAFFISLSIPQLVRTFQFSIWAKTFEHHAIELKEWTPINQIKTNSKKVLIHPFNWRWNNPSMSLIMRNGNFEGGILNHDQYKGWEPFDPKKLTQSPFSSYTKESKYF